MEQLLEELPILSTATRRPLNGWWSCVQWRGSRSPGEMWQQALRGSLGVKYCGIPES
jgi:hypothetical protein